MALRGVGDDISVNEPNLTRGLLYFEERCSSELTAFCLKLFTRLTWDPVACVDVA